jgi:hypothetical protein
MLGWIARSIILFFLPSGQADLRLSGLQERQKSVSFPDSRDQAGWSSRQRGTALASRRSESNTPEKDSLNFKVSPEFKKEFKGFAVSEGISMTSLLKEGFALSKKKRQK